MSRLRRNLRDQTNEPRLARNRGFAIVRTTACWELEAAAQRLVHGVLIGSSGRPAIGPIDRGCRRGLIRIGAAGLNLGGCSRGRLNIHGASAAEPTKNSRLGLRHHQGRQAKGGHGQNERLHGTPPSTRLCGASRSKDYLGVCVSRFHRQKKASAVPGTAEAQALAVIRGAAGSCAAGLYKARGG